MVTIGSARLRPALRQSAAWAAALLFGLSWIAVISERTQAQEPSHSLTIHNDRFEPSTVSVKAGVKFKLVVKNASKRAAEFESAELNREKVIPAGASATIYIGPLQPGSYPFFDDFKKSLKGHIVAK